MNFAKKHILLFILPLGAVTLLAAAILGFQIAFAGKVAPGTTLFAGSIALQDLEEIQKAYSERLAQFERAPITIFHQTNQANSVSSSGQNYIFSLAELGVTLEKERSLADIPVIEVGNFDWGREVKTQFTLNQDVLKNALEVRTIDSSLRAQNAELKWNASRQDFDIFPEQSGWHIDLNAFIRDLTTYIENLSSDAQQDILILRRIEDIPQVTAAQLETARATIKEKVKAPFTFKGPYDEWEIDWKEHMDWLDIGSGGTAVPGVIVSSPAPLTAFVSTQIAPTVEVAPQDVTITRDESGAIAFVGTATDGIDIDYDTLTHLVNLALAENLTTVEIPTITTKGRVNAPPDLQALGIKELIAAGYSGFKSSPPGRRHNIGVAIKRFNGLLVQPGETFSFGEHLGEVDGSTGYVKELVIREGETIPEYGGGVCQVSSTLFRAILFGGFPIVERHPHSYAVTYYAYPLGWGLDATVYPPAVDLKFKNDMGTAILMQAWAEGNEATFKFYGTKDGRTVTMDGPYITDRRPAPPPITVQTDTLPAGVKEKKDTAHNGFTATWYRTVTYPMGHLAATSATAPGVTVSLSNRDAAASPPLILKDTIISPYIPWPERWLVGREAAIGEDVGP